MGNVTVITGGAGGMGLAAAKIMGKDHYVVISDVNQQRLDTAIEELRALDIRCEACVCDVSDKAAVVALAAKASSIGHLASVIHTAGISPQMADPVTILRINAIGTINVADAFYDVASAGFALVNVASMAAHMLPDLMVPKRLFRIALSNPEAFLKKAERRCRLMPNQLLRTGMAYSLSKRFVMWYSATTAGKYGQKGARILSVSPGTFDTEMGRLEEKSGSMKMLDTAALKRPGKPEEMAELLAFCASGKASYLTGVDVLCDGGVIAGRRNA